MALPLLTVAAVPFTFGANQTQHQSSIAARRQIRRLNTSTGCQTGAGPFENLDADKRAIIAVIVSEAAKEIQSVMDLGNRNGSELENFPTQPPNTPNNQLTFDFPTIPRLNRTDGLQPRRNIVAELTSEEEEKAEIVRPKRTRSFRKRRRVPSFKTGQQPRVPATVGCSSSSSEADDESSVRDASDLWQGRRRGVGAGRDRTPQHRRYLSERARLGRRRGRNGRHLFPDQPDVAFLGAAVLVVCALQLRGVEDL